MTGETAEPDVIRAEKGNRPLIELGAIVAPKLNLAMQQNAVPFIRELFVANKSDETVENVLLRVEGDPAFCTPRKWPIDRLAADSRFHITDVKVDLSTAFLEQVTEAVLGNLIFTLTYDAEVLTHRTEVQVLARDEWGGINDLPEIIAAYIQPNDPVVERILRDTSKRLQSAGKIPSLEGYQSNSPQRVAEIASAIWSAICHLDLSYAVPPASFEKNGQKVRQPSRIFNMRLATCLDLTLLFASCLEQAGLNALVVFTRGHTFVGCWLQNIDFSHAVVDDVQAMRKRAQLKELLVWETTLVTHKPPLNFSFACQDAEAKLQNDDEFELAVDVKRARMARIRPVSERVSSDIVGEVGQGTAEPVEVPLDVPLGLPDLPSIVPDMVEEVSRPETPDARLEHWKRKLLDLSLRNRLLNFRATRRAVTIDIPDPGKLEDHLANGKKLRILPSPEMMEGHDPRSRSLHREQRQEEAAREYALRALERGEILVRQTEDRLQASLIELYRASRAAIQEGGANILYLALGFLSWRRDGRAERTPKAPLILIPVQLTRRSARSAFQLTIHEDEPRFNPTLLEMLRQDHGIQMPELEGDLPTDDSGLDVERIWNIVRIHVRDIPGWEVVEDVVLSTFSFAKHLMWKDLQDRAELLKRNPVVKHLIETPREAYSGAGDGFPAPDKLDDIRRPEQTYLPTLADSSQTAAIISAAEGKDFVLIGPPGTGKSQTITNMIAQCMAEAKTVLFVSEKTAALNVVYRRLKEVGLSNFCLELHSNKARKFDVLQQLGAAWDSRGQLDQDVWLREAKQLGSLRDALNHYVRRLHYRYPNGLTVYRAIGEVVRHREVPQFMLSWPSPNSHDLEAFNRLEQIAERIDVNAQQIGNIKDNPLSGIARGDWSPGWQSELTNAVRQLAAAADNLDRAINGFCQAIGISVKMTNSQRVESLCMIRQCLQEAHGKPYGFAFGENSTSVIVDIKDAMACLTDYAEARTATSCRYQRQATQLDLADLTNTWQEAENSWFLKRWLVGRRVCKTLRGVTEGRALPATVAQDLQQLEIARQQETRLREADYLGSILGRMWRGLDTNIEDLKAAIDWAERIQNAQGVLCHEPDDLLALRAAIGRLVREGNEFLGEGGGISQQGQILQHAYERFVSALHQVTGLVEAESAPLFVTTDEDYLGTIQHTCDAWLRLETRLRYWCAWRAVRQEAMANGLAPLVEALETGTSLGVKAAQLFRINYCRWWLNAAVDADNIMRTFVPAEHERRIETFGKIDQEFMRLTRRYVHACLCGNIPSKGEISRGSEWSVLSRELQKKRRHMPLRQLISSMQNSLTKLTPCVMMSPLSIAQYLPPDASLFDVVVFDEASQIPVWDAIGAIARGKQVVIVGDPKQLPPTSFFDRRDDEDSDEDIEVDDLESILDEAIGANLPTLQLNWHYRSRSENLIAFSNHRYYQGRLVTFPAALTTDQSVRYHHVADGVYEKGGARVNKAEAQQIVDSIMARLRDPDFDKTIGVVTFNTEQQALIEDLLEERRRKYPEVEGHFAEDRIEPVFVKNLESVQGDERDIIYFSITYGPDQNRRVSMNFGPLNQEGGQRRLNVAVTRARQEMHVFATLRPEQIDLSRTSAEGVRDLKHFLEFAERGAKALAEAVYGSQGDYDSPFEEAVAIALAEKGWTVHPQVGVSGFRIDLGVVHPDAAGRYLAGVECDGATYHRTATARDRDFLREQVLRGLGWEIIRIWSTDWWTDAVSALVSVHEKLEALLETDRARRKMATGDTTSRDTTTDESDAVTAVNATKIPESEEKTGTTQRPDIAESFVGETDVSQADGASYREADLSGYAGQLAPDRFYDTDYDSSLQSIICHILDQEAPIRLDILAQRVARAHGFRRTGTVIVDRVKQLVGSGYTIIQEENNFFVWKEGTNVDWNTFRVPLSNQTRRVDEVPLQELIVLAGQVIADGHTGDEALSAMARKLGLQRLRAASRDRLRTALHKCLRM